MNETIKTLGPQIAPIVPLTAYEKVLSILKTAIMHRSGNSNTTPEPVLYFVAQVLFDNLLDKHSSEDVGGVDWMRDDALKTAAGTLDDYLKTMRVPFSGAKLMQIFICAVGPYIDSMLVTAQFYRNYGEKLIIESPLGLKHAELFSSTYLDVVRKSSPKLWGVFGINTALKSCVHLTLNIKSYETFKDALFIERFISSAAEFLSVSIHEVTANIYFTTMPRNKVYKTQWTKQREDALAVFEAVLKKKYNVPVLVKACEGTREKAEAKETYEFSNDFYETKIISKEGFYKYWDIVGYRDTQSVAHKGDDAIPRRDNFLEYLDKNLILYRKDIGLPDTNGDFNKFWVTYSSNNNAANAE